MTKAKLSSMILAALGFLLVALANTPVRETPWLWLPLLGLFLLSGPSAGWVGLLRFSDRLVSLAIIVVSSGTLTLLVATLLAVLNLWDVMLGLIILATTGLVGSVVWLLADGESTGQEGAPQ